jgi:hypothetical protein
MGPYLGVAVLYWVLAFYVLRGGFGGLGSPPEFEHPIEEQEEEALATSTFTRSSVRFDP